MLNYRNPLPASKGVNLDIIAHERRRYWRAKARRQHLNVYVFYAEPWR